MPLRSPTDGNGVFLTLLALLLLLLVARLPHECEAQCTAGALVDSLATSASQPALPVSNLNVKLKVLGSSVTVTSVDLYMIPAGVGYSPTGATLNFDYQGGPMPVPLASSTRIGIASGQFQYPFGGVVLDPGFYWLVFTTSSNPISGWTWSDWSGEDNFHSLSFAAAAYSNLVPTMVINGCGAIPASTSPSPSTSPTRSSTPSTTPTPSATPSSSPSPTPTPSPSPSTSVSPSSSPTPSAIPKLMSLTNATAEFDSSQAAFRLSGTFSTTTSSGSATSEQWSVRSQVSSVQIGNVTLLASDFNDTTREVIPATGDKPLTYVYTTLLLSAVEVHQSFAFHERESKASFAGVEFDIEANSVKWSLNITSSANTSSPSSSSSLPHSTQPTIVRYLLAGADVLTAPAPAGAADGRIMRRANTPREGLTTYYLPLEGSAVLATVLLFDMAVVDGVVSPVNHNITLVAVGAAGNVTYKYEVEVELPAFNQWVHYDPSVGMGRLFGADGQGGDGGSDNTGLIVGVAVAVPVAVVAVLAVIAAFGWYKRRALRSNNSINFDVHDGDEDQSDRL